MTVRNIVLLPEGHPQDCLVCGGNGEVRLAMLRLRFGTHSASWPQSWLMPCPLRGGADGLRELFGGVS